MCRPKFEVLTTQYNNQKYLNLELWIKYCTLNLPHPNQECLLFNSHLEIILIANDRIGGANRGQRKGCYVLIDCSIWSYTIAFGPYAVTNVNYRNTGKQII